MDLWVQSIGGLNVSIHVMVNNGDETFTVDTERVSGQVLHNQPHGSWYFAGVHLADIDSDGDLDVLQGQSRDLQPATRNQFNIVLVNDGTGHFPSRIELPHARDDLANRDSATAAYFSQRLGARLAEARQRAIPPERQAITEEEIQRLRALGYLR